MSQKPHLCIVLGIRPDVIRASIFLNLIREDSRVKVTFIWSGQHYSDSHKRIGKVYTSCSTTEFC